MLTLMLERCIGRELSFLDATRFASEKLELATPFGLAPRIEFGPCDIILAPVPGCTDVWFLLDEAEVITCVRRDTTTAVADSQ